MNKICIINGHPFEESYNFALAKSYENGALQSNAEISKIIIANLEFNPNLKFGYSKQLPLEPDLLAAIEKIKNANHIVWFFPMWWYGCPALMKGFIDRAFLPDIAFKYSGKPMPTPLFKGKSGRIVVTADSPRWYTRWIIKNPAINQLKKGTLEFCGIKPVKVNYVGPVKNSTNEFRYNWIKKMYDLGVKMK